MAVYQTIYAYYGDFASDVFTPTHYAGAFNFYFYADGDVFEPGEIIFVDDDNPVKYIGFSPNGIVLQDISGVFDPDFDDEYVYCTSVALVPMDPFSVNTTNNFVYCFLADTQVATPTGPIAVQELAIGDSVLTADGRVVSVRWIGRQSVVTVFGPVESRCPVHIDAGALGAGLPTRDLRVTADHGLMLDGALVQAGALVNGTTIRRMTAAELGERYTVFHVETESHEAILAEGVPAETFVDNVSRRRFDNYAEFEALYGDAGDAIAELQLPRMKSARQLPQAIRRRVDERAGELAAALRDMA